MCLSPHICACGLTGRAVICPPGRKSTERLVLHEAWPDVGPPLPGGLKRGPKRVLRALPPGKEEQTEGVLILVEDLKDGGQLQRTLRLSEDGLLAINQVWTPGEGETSQCTKLKTYGWCAFRQDTLTVPLTQGWQTRPVIYGEYPYGLYDFEAIPSIDPPRHCSDYAENWSAFEEKGLTVGALWQDAAGICFGKHLMPALIFDLGEDGQPISLPDYAYYIGRGGAEAVAHRWRQLYGRQTQESTDTGEQQTALAQWSKQHRAHLAGTQRWRASNGAEHIRARGAYYAHASKAWLSCGQWNTLFPGCLRTGRKHLQPDLQRRESLAICGIACKTFLATMLSGTEASILLEYPDRQVCWRALCATNITCSPFKRAPGDRTR